MFDPVQWRTGFGEPSKGNENLIETLDVVEEVPGRTMFKTDKEIKE